MKKEILREIERLISAFGSSKDTASREQLQNLCDIAGRYPIGVVHRVVSRFIGGEIDGQSLDFPPKPPRFGAALRAEPRQPGEPGFEGREDYLRKYLPPPTQTVSEESKRRVAELIEGFKRGHVVDQSKD